MEANIQANFYFWTSPTDMEFHENRPESDVTFVLIFS